MKDYSSRYLPEGIFIMILMILILLLMVRGSLKAQTPDPLTQTNYTTDSLRSLGLPSIDHAMQPQQAKAATKRTVGMENAKVFVLDENMMFEMMKQDEKIASIMSAAIIRAMGDDARICEFVTEKITTNTSCKMSGTKTAVTATCMADSNATCNCNCACCKKATASRN